MARHGAASITNTSSRHAPSRPFAPSRSAQPNFTDHRSPLTNHAPNPHIKTLPSTQCNNVTCPLSRDSSVRNQSPTPRLEIAVSHRKQTTDTQFNRKLSGTSQNRLFARQRDASPRMKTILESFSHPHPKSRSSS